MIALESDFTVILYNLYVIFYIIFSRKDDIHDENLNELIYKINFISSSIFSKYPNYKLTDDKSYIYFIVYGNVVGTFTGMLTATDEANQTAEIPIYIIIYNWSSKDWVKCSGPYQSEWKLWINNFYLDSTGIWLHSYIYM